VRTVISPAASNAIESSDSNPAIVTPRDIFAPAVPQGLVAAVIVGSPTNPPEVDLSWSTNLETDLAGYRVYRSEQEGTPGQLVTPDVLLSPAYRDTSVQPGRLYWYSVTSVDRSGNESAPSAPVAAEITQPSS
jgi:fibronectin type 3 domain-containing protein